MFSTPLICSSSGAIRCSAQSGRSHRHRWYSPGSSGGDIGILLHRQRHQPNKPRMTMRIRNRIDSTGRLINLSNFIRFFFVLSDHFCAAAACLHLLGHRLHFGLQTSRGDRLDRHAVTQRRHTFDNHLFTPVSDRTSPLSCRYRAGTP